jgi:ABC-2 type transport system ATP-binding protein
MASIVAQSLIRLYGPIKAVDDLSFEVTGGTVLGFLGPNGAGKSTTMKMLTGFLRPSAGDALINGHNLRTEALGARQAVGYLPEGAPMYPEMSGPNHRDALQRFRSPCGDRPSHDSRSRCIDFG